VERMAVGRCVGSEGPLSVNAEAIASNARCLTNVAAGKHFSDAASPQW
jgi:hypothetical protein